MSWIRSGCWLALLLALASCGDACGAKPKPPPPEPKTEAPEPAEKPAPKVEAPAVLEGAVRSASPAAPSFLPDEMERKIVDHAKRGAWPAECTPPKIADSTPLLLTDEGKLSGVVVAASGFKKASAPRPPRVHEVVIRDCRLTPSVVLAQKGDKLRVTSEIKFPFMPGYGPPAQIKTLIPGQTYEVELNTLGASPLMCGFTAPCGRTDVIVLSHTYATVTDQQGNFRFDSFPADERVKVSAWHPLLNATDTEIEVAAGETKSVELLVSPLVR